MFERFNKKNLVFILISLFITVALFFGITGCQKVENKEISAEGTTSEIEEKDTLEGDLVVFHA